jgi:MFS family permease
LHRRLAILMFLQYAVPGAWVPLFSLHLQELRFTPGEIAWACATAALGALGAPLFWGQMADRWVAAERCIFFCAVMAAVLLWVLAQLTDPLVVFLVSLGYWFFMIPILSLGASLTFRHLEHPEKDFGRIRLWGTVGWAGAGWGLGLWFYVQGMSGEPTELSDSLRWASLLAVVLSGYSLTLPGTPPSSPREEGGTKAAWLGWKKAFDAPLRAFQLLRQRSFAVYCGCMLGLYVTIPFNSQMTPLFLKHLGVPSSWLPVILTLGQSLEVITLGLLPIILLRLGTRGTLILGIVAWTAGLCILTVGRPTWLVVSCLGIQGIFICCFLVAGQVFVNSRARQDFRASAQAMLQFINGTGLLCGHLLVGAMRDWTGGDFLVPYATAAGMAGGILVVFLVGFKEKN